MKFSITRQISVDNSCSEFHENPTNNLATNIVTNVVFTYGVLFFLLRKELPICRTCERSPNISQINLTFTAVDTEWQICGHPAVDGEVSISNPDFSKAAENSVVSFLNRPYMPLIRKTNYHELSESLDFTKQRGPIAYRELLK